MWKLLIHWLLSSLCLLIVAHLVPGFVVHGFGAALFASLAIGLINGTLGWLLKIVTLPLTILTFGIFWFVVNAVMLVLASAMVPGFEIHGFWPAFSGGLILSLLNLMVRALL